MDIRNFFSGKAAVTEKTVSGEKGNAQSESRATQPEINIGGKNDSSREGKENVTYSSSCTRESKSVTNEVSASVESVASPTSLVASEPIPAELATMITWKVGEPIPYMAVVQIFDEVSQVSGRLEKENLFAKLFRAAMITTPSDLDVVVYLASNEVFPVYDGMELGIGDSLLVKAVCEATGRKKDAVEEAYEREGDLGTVALLSRANQKTLSFAAKPKPLLARYVLEQFRLIAQIKGDKAQARKVDVIKALMVKCQGSEAKFIVRALQGKLRIGTAQQTVLVALAHAVAEAQLQLSMSPPPTTSDPSSSSSSSSESSMTRILAADVTAWLEETKKPKEQATVHEKKEREEEEKEEKEEELQAETAPLSAGSSNETDGKPLLDLISAIPERETPEAIQLKEFSCMYYSGATRATATALQKLPKEARWQCAEMAVKRAFSEYPNISVLVSHLLTQPLHHLYASCRLNIGIPVAPMLAKPTKQIGEVLKRLSGQAFTMEYKYDGERAQVHLLPDGTVKIFSRNCEDNSEKYPDLRDVVRLAAKPEVSSCIIDAEVVAYDREQRCLLPFQILSTRKRKVEAGEEDSQKVKVILQIFDLLYMNGKSLLRESLRTRRQLMHAAFDHTEGLLHFASGLDHVENGDTAPIETFLQESCVAMCEGLMVKTLDDNASYEPSKRSMNWLKLKKDYIEGMGVCDSVDLVCIGGFYGRGKRTNVYGAYLMACYDPDRDEYQSVCKVGTGFKDEDLARLHAQMKEHVIASQRRPINYNVSDVLTPDEWFDAARVWELQAADLSKSSVHSGGASRIDGNNARGIGLRFPRYLRDREDKKPEMATTAEQIVDMFYSQALTEDQAGGGDATNGAKNGDDDDDDWI